jgi:hypothetical protein
MAILLVQLKSSGSQALDVVIERVCVVTPVIWHNASVVLTAYDKLHSASPRLIDAPRIRCMQNTSILNDPLGQRRTRARQHSGVRASAYHIPVKVS